MRLNTDDFRRRATIVHNGTYNYELSIYSGYQKKLTIKCPVHGLFEQVAGEHLRGRGCYQCGRIINDKLRSKDTSWFIQRAKKVHGEKYDYSQSNYTHSRNKIKINCPIHGDFEQFSLNHLAGMGCKSCANDKLSKANAKTTSWFLGKAREVHGNKYDYSSCVYNNKKRVVKIICRKHGHFMQSPTVHLRGSGCSKCNMTGFDRMSDGFMYALISDCGQYIKVGISNDYTKRMKRLAKSTPFSFSLIGLMSCDGYYAAENEREILRSFKSAGLSGFDGCTEWLFYSKPLMAEVLRITR